MQIAARPGAKRCDRPACAGMHVLAAQMLWHLRAARAGVSLSEHSEFHLVNLSGLCT